MNKNIKLCLHRGYFQIDVKARYQAVSRRLIESKHGFTCLLKVMIGPNGKMVLQVRV